MGVSARTHGSEVTRLGATDLGFEVPGHAQQAILGGVDVAGTSEPQILAPSSAPRSVELIAMDPGAEHGFKTHGQVSLAEAAFMYNF